MQTRKLIVRHDTLLNILAIYLIGIIVWDYTIIYQVALAIMVLMCVCMYRNLVVKNTTILKMELLLVIYFFFHTLFGFTIDDDLSRSYLLTMMINLIAIICITRIINSRKQIEFTMKVIIGVSLILSFYIVIVDFGNLFSGHLGEEIEKLLTGGVYSHNDVSLVAATSVLFLMYFYMKNERFHFHKAQIIYLSMFVILTGARKSFLLIVLALLIYPMLFSKIEAFSPLVFMKTCFKVVGAILVVLLIFYILLTNNFLYDVIGRRFEGYFIGLSSSQFMESSASTRQIMIETAKLLIARKPMIGYGLNTFRMFEGSFNTWSHNNYLELWVSGGIIPVIIYYSYYFIIIKKLLMIKLDNMAGMFLVYMSFLFVHDYLSVSYISRYVMFMLVLVNVFIISKERSHSNY